MLRNLKSTHLGIFLNLNGHLGGFQLENFKSIFAKSVFESLLSLIEPNDINLGK